MDEHNPSFHSADDGRVARRRNFVLAGIALLPAICAFLFADSQPMATPLSGAISRDHLLFAQYAIDLGQVPPVATVPAHFDFRNLGTQNLKITSLEPSCGCLDPRLFNNQKEYAPGESGRFYVSVSTATESPGPKNYFVKVNYDDGEPRSRLLSFRMVIPEKKVTVTPSEVYFYQTHGRPDVREILVQDHRGTRLNVLSVNIESELVTAEIGERRPVQEGVEVPIRLSVPGDVPPGRQTCWLKINTSDPEYQLLRVPVLIQGPTESISESRVQPVSHEEVSFPSEDSPIEPVLYDHPDSKSSAP